MNFKSIGKNSLRKMPKQDSSVSVLTLGEASTMYPW